MLKFRKFSRILFRKNLMRKKITLLKTPINTFCKKKDNDKDDIFDEIINMSKKNGNEKTDESKKTKKNENSYLRFLKENKNLIDKDMKNEIFEDDKETEKKREQNKKKINEIKKEFNKLKDLIKNGIPEDLKNNLENELENKNKQNKDKKKEFFDMETFLKSFIGIDQNKKKSNDKKDHKIKKDLNIFEDIFKDLFNKEEDNKNDNKKNNDDKKNKNQNFHNFLKNHVKEDIKIEKKDENKQNLKNSPDSKEDIDEILNNIFGKNPKEVKKEKKNLKSKETIDNIKNSKFDTNDINVEKEKIEKSSKTEEKEEVLKNSKTEEKGEVLKSSKKEEKKEKKKIKKEDIDINKVYDKILSDIKSKKIIEIDDFNKILIYNDIKNEKLNSLDKVVLKLEDPDFYNNFINSLLPAHFNYLKFNQNQKWGRLTLRLIEKFIENKLELYDDDVKDLKKNEDKKNKVFKEKKMDKFFDNFSKDIKKEKQEIKQDKGQNNKIKKKINKRKEYNLDKDILLFIKRVKYLKKKKILQINPESEEFLSELEKKPELIKDLKKVSQFFKDTLFYIDKNIEKKEKSINFFKNKIKENEKNIFLKYYYSKYISTFTLNKIDLIDYQKKISFLIIALKKVDKKMIFIDINEKFKKNDFFKFFFFLTQYSGLILIFLFVGYLIIEHKYIINKEVFDLKLVNSEVKNINIKRVKNHYNIDSTDFIYETKDIEEFFKNTDKIENISTKKNLVFDGLRSHQNFNSMDQYFFTLALIGILFLLRKQVWKEIGKMGNKTHGSKEFKNKTGIKFSDVAGLKEVKEEMMEFVDFLKDPEKFKKLGATMPKGALLTGPPGTGKTFLAKAVSGEAKVPFFYISGSEFVEKFVGVGASRVRDLFKEAKKKSPSIIFIDEIDAIGKKRDSSQGNDETENTLNQLLVEMDGFGTYSNVIVMGSTNLKDSLDTALLRPGRFDRIIEVNLPNLIEREEIFKIYLQKVNLDEKYSMSYFSKRLATLTPGFSGADISNICNEAAIIAVRNNNEKIQELDFEEAIEKVIGGIERKSEVFEEQKETVSVHESGHAVVSWFLEGGNPLLKLTIKPRSKGALGFAQYLPPETSLYKKNQLKDQIASILGGRVAEMVFFGKSSTGAYDDFQKAKRLAFEMVTNYGMSERLNFVRFSFDEYGNKNFSEKTHTIIDEEVDRIIKEETERCFKIVKEKKSFIKKLSTKLLEKEVLIFSDIVKILGDRPFKPNENFKRFLDEVKKINGNEKVVV